MILSVIGQNAVKPAPSTEASSPLKTEKVRQVPPAALLNYACPPLKPSSLKRLLNGHNSIVLVAAY